MTIEDGVTCGECDVLVDVLERHVALTDALDHEGLCNRCCDQLLVSCHAAGNPDIRAADDMLNGIVHRALQMVQKYFDDTYGEPLFQHAVRDGGYKLCKFRGATLKHADGMYPVKRDPDTVGLRVGTLIMILSDTDDELVFPFQGKTIKYRKGMVVFMPPYWTHPHFTRYTGRPRYAATTFLSQDFGLSM